MVGRQKHLRPHPTTETTTVTATTKSSSHNWDQLFHPQGEVEAIIKKISKRVQGKRGFLECDLDDIEQELRLDLFQRLNRLEPENLPGFTSHVARNRAFQIIKAGRRKFYDGLPDETSLDSELTDAEGNSSNLGETIGTDEDRRRPRPDRSAVELVDLRLDLESAMSALTEQQRALCAQLSNQNVTEYSREIGKPTASVYRQIEKAREPLECAGLREYSFPSSL